MKDQITIKLPPAELRRNILIGVGILVFTGMLFSLANLWSENQALQEQVAVLKRGTSSTTQQPTATATPTDTIQDVASNIIPSVGASDRVQGSRSAKIFFVEYSDLECPYCKRFNDQSLGEIQQKYGDQVAYVWRDFPLTIHANANMEAQIAQCVAQVQGEKDYYAFIAEVFAKTQSTGVSFDEAAFLKLAKDKGYSIDAITACYRNGDMKARIAQDISDGTKAGVTGTPTAFIVRASDGKTKMIAGAVPTVNFEQAIEDLLNS